MNDDPLQAERLAFLSASAEASNAARGLLRLNSAPPVSRDDSRILLDAMRNLAEKQCDALTALDRFVLHGIALGIERTAMAALVRGRVGLARSLGVTLRQVELTERLLATDARPEGIHFAKSSM